MYLQAAHIPKVAARAYQRTAETTRPRRMPVSTSPARVRGGVELRLSVAARGQIDQPGEWAGRETIEPVSRYQQRDARLQSLSGKLGRMEKLARSMEGVEEEERREPLKVEIQALGEESLVMLEEEQKAPVQPLRLPGQRGTAGEQEAPAMTWLEDREGAKQARRAVEAQRVRIQRNADALVEEAEKQADREDQRERLDEALAGSMAVMTGQQMQTLGSGAVQAQASAGLADRVSFLFR